MVEIKLLNFKKLQKKVKGWDKHIKKSINDALGDIVNMLKQEVQKEIIKKSPSNGPVTRYGGKKGKRTVLPARKGYSPNSDTGALLNSIGTKVARSNMTGWVGSRNVGGATYGGILEDEKRLNRPFLEPVVKKKQKKARDMMLAHIKKGGFIE